MKKYLSTIILLALIAASINVLWPKLTGGTTADDAQPETVENIVCNFSGTKTVTKVIDGDTVVAAGESIRLLGIDTDERGYPCYSVAKKRLEAFVLGKDVELECDVEDKDMYDRYLRYIFLNGTNINLQMVHEGLAIARFEADNIKYKSEILAAEDAAHDAGIGCKWSQTEWTAD